MPESIYHNGIEKVGDPNGWHLRLDIRVTDAGVVQEETWNVFHNQEIRVTGLHTPLAINTLRLLRGESIAT